MSAKIKAVVLDGFTLNPGDNPWHALEQIVDLTVYDRMPLSLIVERAAHAPIVISNKTPIDAETIAALPGLRFISMLATGYNVIDVAAARAQNIPVSNVPSYGTDTVAQHTFALLLELCHRCQQHSDAVRAGEWSSNPDFSFWKSPLIELSGRTLGIVGYGRISRRVAEIGAAFGMTVQFFSRHPQPNSHARFVSLDELLRTSDVVSLHCALSPDSQGMIDSNALTLMKKSAFLLNTSRGALINEADLANALCNGVIAGAGLDVLCQEPPPLDHPLFGMPNCLITPHIAWSSIEARRRLMAITVENVQAFIDGTPINVVNE